MAWMHKGATERNASEPAGAESRTRVLMFYEAHTLDSLTIFKEFVETKHPSAIILEEEKNINFQQMLKGKTTVKQYMQGLIYPHRDFIEKRYELLVKIHKEMPEIRIEQFEPNLELNIKNMMRINITGDMQRCISRGDFEGGVRAVVEYVMADSEWVEAEDKLRAKGIAGKIRSGEWGGYILIEAGAVHTRVGHFLGEYLGKDAELSSFHALKGDAAKAFEGEAYGGILDEAYPPLHELKRLYMFGKEVTSEREELLGARAMIFFKTSVEAGTAIDNVSILKAAGLANKLSYDECNSLFKEIYARDLGAEDAFKLVESHVKSRPSKADFRDRIL